MEHLLLPAVLLLLATYASLVFVLYRGARPVTGTAPVRGTGISVIIAARNEAERLPRLLTSLGALTYPRERFEVIVVDDRSEDDTAERAERFRTEILSLQIIRLRTNESGMPHKKNALRHGIAAAAHPLLVFTDADCTVPPGWLDSLAAAFDSGADVVAGYSPNGEGAPPLLASYLHHEEMMNSVIAAGAAGNGAAFMCTGRNFAYRRSVYDAAGGFDAVTQSISGDDDLFLQHLRANVTQRIVYWTAPESFVETEPPRSLSSFIGQRVRHISASKHYPFAVNAAFAAGHLHLLFTLLLLFVQPLYGIVSLLGRINADAALAVRGEALFGRRSGIVEFFRNELLSFAYVLFIGPAGLLARFSWKGTSSR